MTTRRGASGQALYAWHHDGAEVADVAGSIRRALSTDGGGRAASGVYFYRLHSEGLTLTKKMVLLR